MSVYTINIRPKRQATFPALLLEKMGVSVGDELSAEIEKEQIILKPKKKILLDALSEIQRLIKKSGVSESELQKSAREDRKRWARKYGT